MSVGSVRSGIDPVKLPVYKVQPWLTLFVLEFANHGCFLWLLYPRLLGVRLMSTGIMEIVAQGFTLVRIWTTPSAVCILRMSHTKCTPRYVDDSLLQVTAKLAVV